MTCRVVNSSISLVARVSGAYMAQGKSVPLWPLLSLYLGLQCVLPPLKPDLFLSNRAKSEILLKFALSTVDEAGRRRSAKLDANTIIVTLTPSSSTAVTESDSRKRPRTKSTSVGAISSPSNGFPSSMNQFLFATISYLYHSPFCRPTTPIRS